MTERDADDSVRRLIKKASELTIEVHAMGTTMMKTMSTATKASSIKASSKNKTARPDNAGNCALKRGSTMRRSARKENGEDCATPSEGGRRGALLGAALAGLGVAFGGQTSANAALPQELTEPDKIFSEDFNVSFAGLEVDHKDLIYALVIGQTIGFIGSAVGGAEARKRAEEIERLNATLLKVNKEVRKELRSTQGRKVATPTDSTDEGSSEVVIEIISLLKAGKAKLKQQSAKDAKISFNRALELIKSNRDALKEPWKAVRKAERGLGAASARLGEYEEALTHMKTVLSLSTEHNDSTVATDAYGIIADIYADMDQVEIAADWYDKYFAALAREESEERAQSAR